MRRIAAILVGLVCLISPSAAFADTLVEVPAAWRLEVFTSSHTVAVFFTGASNCTTGKMTLGNASTDDVNKFYALVLTAKMARKPIGLFYTASSGTCVIETFYID